MPEKSVGSFVGRPSLLTLVLVGCGAAKTSAKTKIYQREPVILAIGERSAKPLCVGSIPTRASKLSQQNVILTEALRAAFGLLVCRVGVFVGSLCILASIDLAREGR